MRNDFLIEVNNVTKTFISSKGNVTALKNVNLNIQRGHFMAVVGPSGCGKSTLLNLIAGLDSVSSGTIRYDGEVINSVNKRVGYITQHETLLPWRTVESNVGIALEIKKVPPNLRREKIQKYIELVGLKGFDKFYPYQLSGGMRKRVGLIRTLIYDPETILMDEPFGALDAQLKLVMQDELLRIYDLTKKTCVFVTHDLGEAISVADTVVIFTGRPGTVKQIENIPIPRPRSVSQIRFSATFGELYEKLWHGLKEEVSKGENL